MNNTTTYSVGSVLDAYYELLDLAGPAEGWSERAFRRNPPRLYRFQQLQALLRAFNLPSDPKSLESSLFLRERDEKVYQFLYDELLESYQQGELSRPPCSLDTASYGMLYQQFFRLLREQHRLLRFNSGWLEAGSAEAQYAIRVAERFVNSYDHAQLAAVKQTVCRILDPVDRQFLRQELITQFDFPDVDLHEIDFDWM